MLTSTTRTNRGRGLLLGLIAGLVSFGAAAAEEVTVYAAAAPAPEAAELKAELKEYLEALNEQLKERIEADMKQQPAARIELALGEIPSRG